MESAQSRERRQPRGSVVRSVNAIAFVPTIYPCVPGHEILGRVTSVGAEVTRFKPGDLAAVGCLVDSDRTCPDCLAGLGGLGNMAVKFVRAFGARVVFTASPHKKDDALRLFHHALPAASTFTSPRASARASIMATTPGSPIGGLPETQEMLDFCGERNLTAGVEIIPIQKVNEAYTRLPKSDVKSCFTTDMASLKSE